MAKKSFVILILTVSFLLINIQADAQIKKGRKNVVKKTTKPICKVSSLIFKCPDDYSMPENLDESTVFLKNDYKSSITYNFVSVPGENFDEKSLTENVATQLAAKLLPAEPQRFIWKELEDPSLMDFQSKYQLTLKSVLGFNNNIRVNFVSRHFSFNKKDIFVGYLYVMDRGEEAKTAFERGFGGDNAIGCNALAEIVYSITKEKLGKDEFPCTLRIMRGQ